jgi:tetratricopeptide (TPR) repeat protein
MYGNNDHYRKAIEYIAKINNNPIIPTILETIRNHKFNQQSLNDLNSALDHIKYYTGRDDRMDKLLSSLSSQHINQSRAPVPHNALYNGPGALLSEAFDDNRQMQLLMDDTPEIELDSPEVTNYKMAEASLVRYRDDFQRLLKDVYKDIKEQCEVGNDNALNKLLHDDPWMCQLLFDNDGELGILAIEAGHQIILEIIFSKFLEIDPTFLTKQDYLQSFLKIAVDHNQSPCVDYLLKQGVNPMLLLDNNQYYGENYEWFVKLATAHLSPEYVNYCIGRFEFENGRYPEAVKQFRQINTPGLLEDALFYLGYSHEKLLDTIDANWCFEKLLSSTKYKDMVEEHMVTIRPRVKTIKNFSVNKAKVVQILDEVISKNNILRHILLSDLEPKMTDFMSKIEREKDIKGITVSLKELKQLLAETKYVRIKQAVDDQVVVAEEFKDVKEISGLLQPGLNSQYLEYRDALDILNDTLGLIGEVSRGMIEE